MTDAAAAQPYLKWILAGGGTLLVGLAVAAWKWWSKWSKRPTTAAASAQNVLSRNSLRKLRKHFLGALPWRYRMSVDDFPTVVVLGPDEKGKTELIKQEVDWERQQRQFLPSYTDDDLLVKFYLSEGEDIGHFVNEKVHRIDGIQDTKTIITFKAF